MSKDLILQKEKEWRDLLISKLERAEYEREKAEHLLKDCQEKMSQLETDFKHNLNLLNERDVELTEFEKQNEELREIIHENENKISSLCVEIDELRIELRNQDEVKSELKEKLKNVIEKGYSDMNVVKMNKMHEIEQMRDEYTRKVKELERKLVQIEAQAVENRQALMNEVQDTLYQRENDLKRESEQIHTEIMSYELKYRLVSKELDLLKTSKAEIVVELAEKEQLVREMEMKISEMDLAFKSELSIAEMKRQTENLKSKEREGNLLMEIEKLNRKLELKNDALKTKAELGKRLEVEITNLLTNSRAKELDLQKEIELVQSELDVIKAENVELNSKIIHHQDIIKGKDGEMQRLIGRMTEESARKDGEMRNMRQEVDSMRQELRKKQEELMELRNELEYAVGKDLELSRRRETERESWESKLEKVRFEEMAKIESMVKSITKARDEAVAEAKHLRKEMENRKEVKICTRCSETSNRLMVDNSIDESELARLRKQNEQLKEIISKMSEEAAKDVNPVVNQSSKVPETNRHILTLAERNRQLQQEKIELLASCRKLQARLDATEVDNANLKQLLRQRETEIGQIKFELDSLQRHADTDSRTVRRRLQELETELSVSRKEAEEYYKGNLELGRVVEDLQSELTLLKSEQFSRIPSLNFGAQEMLIEQLRKEILELRKNVSYDKPIVDYGEFNDGQEDALKQIKVLKSKLKLAANHIKSLASEKQVLIQISNRLRAELKRAGIQMPSTGNYHRHTQVERVEINPQKKDIQKTIGDLDDKLLRLEKLQKSLKNYYEDHENQTMGKHNDDINNHNDAIVKDPVSSLGRESVEEVFKLLDDGESLGQSSFIGMKVNERTPNKSNGFLLARGIKLNPKRNLVTNK